ncbi:uroporphyrinogen-III synthase [Roseomonas sp. NAR14]|uniref:Uroporphyrinogen-III synthase n=1 Tax=Roseomonas acroporae TaxID=2937791 RepID=A0A9X1Y8V9_9PROT|nr:uroporphyrinogen-III synthase [Roseomonas acroporae]MCK8785273.1 uroporphyrinogen-III synthase [Roseomonas acroporae]
MADAVLITRPEPGAAGTARAVAALGWQPVAAPALLLAPRPPAILPPAQALLLTSRAAARALAPDPAPSDASDASSCDRALPVLAVGDRTAAEARERGFRRVESAGRTAAELAALAAARLDPGAGPLLLAVGEGYGAELAAALRGRGFRVHRRVVYRAAPAPSLPPPARAALAAGRIGAALFYSPRSAACAMTLLREAGLAGAATRMLALAISPRVAETLRAAPVAWRAVHVAAQPDEAALLALLGRADRTDAFSGWAAAPDGPDNATRR